MLFWSIDFIAVMELSYPFHTFHYSRIDTKDAETKTWNSNNNKGYHDFPNRWIRDSNKQPNKEGAEESTRRTTHDYTKNSLHGDAYFKGGILLPSLCS